MIIIQKLCRGVTWIETHPLLVTVLGGLLIALALFVFEDDQIGRPFMARVGQHNETSLIAQAIQVTSQFKYKNTGRGSAEDILIRATLLQGVKKLENVLGDDISIRMAPEERLNFKLSTFQIPLERDKFVKLMSRYQQGDKIEVTREVTLASPVFLTVEVSYFNASRNRYQEQDRYKYDMKLNQWIVEK